MDLLLQSALAFQQLLSYQYHITAGRKGKLLQFTISFEPSDFHHLAGLHKLSDNIRFQTGKRSDIFNDILKKKLTDSQIRQSSFYQNMQMRLTPLANLEAFLDSNQIIFRYNNKIHTYSMIQADYLLQNDCNHVPAFLFLAKRSYNDTMVCRSLFPKTTKDYAQGQPRYTLLRKTKQNLQTGQLQIQYERTPAPKNFF